MLVLNNVEVMYDHVILVLKGLSMAVPEGKVVALLGSNGAGKSTTLKAISGLLRTEEGEVTDGSVWGRGRSRRAGSIPSGGGPPARPGRTSGGGGSSTSSGGAGSAST